MSRFFKPYEGNRPYLFISYAHKQSEEVVSTATGLPTSPGICRAARE